MYMPPYSNKRSYDSVTPKENAALVPFLAHEVLKNYHQDIRDGFRKRNEGIIEDNFETWNIRGRMILVGFTAIPKDEVKSFMEGFWEEKDDYMDDNSDDDTNSSGWESADDSDTENSVLSLMMIDDLINEVSLKYPEAKAIFSLLMEDPQISNALKQVDLNKGKSQTYDYVKKMQSYAKKLYNKNYR